MRFKRETWRGVWVAAFVLAWALALAPAASAQLDQWGFWENGLTEHWWFSSRDFKAEDATGAVARWGGIGEVKEADTWAGDYFRGGETHGTYMRWSPAGFVIAHVNKCEARVTGLVYGRVEVTPTAVQFFPELDKESAGSHGGHHGGAAPQSPAAPRAVLRFVPVRWRGARLLVAEDELEDFGDYVAGLGRFNDYGGRLALGYDHFFLRRGAGAEDDGAPPVFPPGYERFIKKPVEARVTAVGPRVLRRGYAIEGKNPSQMFERASVTRVTIDAGTEQGVKDGMLFRVARPDEGALVLVLRAGRRTSTAAVVRDVDEGGAETFYDERSKLRRHPKVARGWRLTTAPQD